MLTSMQQRIYSFISSFLQERGYPPSVREIGEAVGLRSPSTVHFHLKKLSALGLLEIGAGKGRALRLTGRSCAPAPVPKAGWQAEITPEQDPPGGVPIVGDVAAGSPILAQECIEDYLPYTPQRRGETYFALRVRGESMRDAGILPGDLVVVQQQSTCRQGEIVVALLEDEATVKRFSRQAGRVWLLPENPDYQPIDGTGAQILGRVEAVVRQY